MSSLGRLGTGMALGQGAKPLPEIVVILLLAVVSPVFIKFICCELAVIFAVLFNIVPVFETNGAPIRKSSNKIGG